MIDIKFILDVINQAGIVGLLVLVLAGLIWHVRKNTIPREAFEVLREHTDEQANQFQEMRQEWQTIGPSLGRIADIQQKQYDLMEQTLQRVDALEVRIEETLLLEGPKERAWRTRREE
jgi:flagellar biosynthesis/type III secretory pathway M-ring protein FliF/YscJ